jgi:ADP-heptose:LPS heptosyltransferase
MTDQELYVDEPTVVSFFFSEIGWLIQRWQAHLRYLKHEVYKDHKFLIFMNTQLYPIVHDFASYMISLPKEWNDLGLETDCYEAPPIGSPPGSLTPPNAYAALIQYCRHFYNVEKAIEYWPPRGYNTWVDKKPQKFAKYASDVKIESDRDIICVFPRARARAANRNVPEFIWRQTVDELKKSFLVVLGGTPNGSCLADYEDKNVVNLISYNEQDKLEKIMEYLCNAKCSISSQSGLTHLSLLCDTPSLIIGHERTRHAISDNRFSTPVSFRYVADYRGIDSITILNDLSEFFKALHQRKVIERQDTPFDDVLNEETTTLKSLVGGTNE